jgi:hypothetical protein
MRAKSFTLVVLELFLPESKAVLRKTKGTRPASFKFLVPPQWSLSHQS